MYIVFKGYLLVYTTLCKDDCERSSYHQYKSLLTLIMVSIKVREKASNLPLCCHIPGKGIYWYCSYMFSVCHGKGLNLQPPQFVADAGLYWVTSTLVVCFFVTSFTRTKV